MIPGILSYLLFTLLAAALALRASPTSEIRIAAAADLKFAMRELAGDFQKSTGIQLDVTFGSSGNFFSQLQNGAPFDMFLSADIDYPKKLEAADLTEPGTLYPYASGKIVLWLPQDSKIDLAKLEWKALLDPSIQKIAIANPEHAPYGRAAIAAMRAAGLYEQLKSKLVYGENISQAAQFVQSGNAQAGILALSFAVSPALRDGKSWTIPAQQYPQLLQGAVVLKNAANKTEALRFLGFLKTDVAKAILQKYGLALPTTATASGNAR